MTRQEANRKIIEKLTKIVECEPDWRFHQILQNVGIESDVSKNIDHWYDESEYTLDVIENYLFYRELDKISLFDKR